MVVSVRFNNDTIMHATVDIWEVYPHYFVYIIV